jgi:hypothetical protein
MSFVVQMNILCTENGLYVLNVGVEFYMKNKILKICKDMCFSESRLSGIYQEEDKIILDMSEVDISSSRLFHCLVEKREDLVLFNVSDQFMGLIKNLGLTELLTIAKDLEEADEILESSFVK